MLNIADTLHRWCREAQPFALATVIDVVGSAPLPVGTSVAVDRNGNAVGSISGGCVEGAVYDLCRQVLDQGDSQRAWFGYSDDDAFAVGLTCGGELDVHVQRIDPEVQPFLGAALADVLEGRPTALSQVIDGPEELLGRMLYVDAAGAIRHDMPGAAARREIGAQTWALLRAGRTARAEVGGDAGTCPERLSLLVHVHASRPRMLIFGAVDFAGALSQAGRFLGYHVTVCDARPVFATRTRFPDADEVTVDWPHRYLAAEVDGGRIDSRTVICVLTHDPKFDVPVLEIALRLPQVGYIGAMGSRKTHEERLQRLREAGLSDAEIARLSSPIGLDLGARTPEETAVSIAAEIVGQRWGGHGVRLAELTGRIHHSAS